MKVYHALDQLWNGAFPATCVLCHGAGCNGMALCECCLQDLPWHGGGCRVCADPLTQQYSNQLLVCGRCQRSPPAFQQVVAALSYSTPVDMLVRSYKFDGTLHLGRLLSDLFLYRCAPPRVDVLLPVPLHDNRLQLRGFNQSVELGRFLARALNIPLQSDWLSRTRDSVAQSTLLARDRRRSMAGLFIGSSQVAGQKVALVDDVVTTGSTANACALALRRAGAASVQVWTISRA
ncbi:MAG: double zinc ribbon domain-containing protein [Lysobacterales bacterium]